jgi:hypothetical protein
VSPFHLRAPISVALLVIGTSAGNSQDPGRGSKDPSAADVERFRALDPAKRLQLVEARPDARTAFTKVERGDLAVTVHERGSLEAADVADLACEIKARGKDGVAASIKWLIPEGSAVKKGDRVAELDAPVVRDELKAAAGDAARVRALKAELEKCVLKAPMDGIAVYVVPPAGRLGQGAAAVVGDTVKEGQKLVQVVDLRKMLLVTGVVETQLGSVKVGRAARVQVDAFAGKPVGGTVTRIAANPAAGNGLPGHKVYPVTVALEETPLRLKPQMSADVWIAAGERKGVLLAPAKAIVVTRQGPVCFVKDGDKLVERTVKTAGTDGTRVELADGLKEGDAVLADPLAMTSRN